MTVEAAQFEGADHPAGDRQAGHQRVRHLGGGRGGEGAEINEDLACLAIPSSATNQSPAEKAVQASGGFRYEARRDVDAEDEQSEVSDGVDEATADILLAVSTVAPALPVIAQLLLAAFLAIGGCRRYLRRHRSATVFVIRVGSFVGRLGAADSAERPTMNGSS